MMKLQLISIASVSVVSFLTITIKVGEAKTNRVTPLLPIVKTTQISQRQPIVNTELLVKAITSFWQSDRYLTESKSIITAKNTVGNFQVKLSSKTIAQTGAKFRSEITFIQPEYRSKLVYVVISDGEQVWTYIPQLKQYSVTAVDEFKESFLIGISSVVFMQFPENARKKIAQNQSSEDVLQAIGLRDYSSLKVEQGIIENQQVSVYRYFDPKDGFNFSSFIESASGILKQLQFSGENKGYDILITEKILQRTPAPEITSETFQFIPPADVQQVESLNIGLF